MGQLTTTMGTGVPRTLLPRVNNEKGKVFFAPMSTAMEGLLASGTEK